MTFPFDKNRRFSVIGMGRSGIAAANFLNSAGFDVMISDSKAASDLENSIRLLNAGISVITGRNEVRRGDVAIISPGIPPHSPVFQYAVENASELIGEIELFYRFCPAPIIAVTGTDGKSTVTTLTGHILQTAGLKTHVGGNLGNPLTGMLCGITADSVVVAEVSCFQLITTRRFRPKVAVVTNIAEDHTDYHWSFENYIAAKKMVLMNMAEGDCFVKNMDDPEISGWHAPAGACIMEISLERDLDNGIWRNGGDIVITRNGKMERIVGIAEISIKGRHNIENVALSAGCAAAFGVGAREIGNAVKSYKALPHRIELVAEVGGVIYLDDSKATNPHSAEAALKSLEGAVILISGGYDKGLDLAGFADAIAAKAACVVLLKGSGADRLAGLIAGRVAIKWADSMKEAVETARLVAEGFAAGSCDAKVYVLLSPGFSSYDRYGSYEERGEDFKKQVDVYCR